MQMFTTQLPDAKLLVLAKVALAPGGAVDDYGVALLNAGIKPSDTLWLRDNGYLEVATRHAAGGDLPQLKITDKGVRDLRLRFVG